MITLQLEILHTWLLYQFFAGPNRPSHHDYHEENLNMMVWLRLSALKISDRAFWKNSQVFLRLGISFMLGYNYSNYGRDSIVSTLDFHELPSAALDV